MGITNLDIHRGLTKKLRVQAAPPTTPTPTASDVFIDNTSGQEALALRNESGWVFINLSI